MSGKNEEGFSFVQTEHEILEFWDQEKIFEKSLEKTKSGAPYLFYDGPPFATGLPHHGHLVGCTLKDIIPRYFTMKGRYVERRFGWDTHGLPIENEIDKKLGMSALDAVEKLGIAGYNKECRSIVHRYTEEWRKTIRRIGRWVDMDNDYKTMDLDFMESVWWVFKSLWDKDLIYNGTKVVPFSIGLGTGLSNFEAGLDYRDVQDPAVTILFKLDGEENYISAWTTTPWTLPSNLALCVNKEIDYVLVKDNERNIQFYLAKSRLEHYSKKNSLEIIQELKGSELIGKTYEPLFPYFQDLKEKGCFQVFEDDYVTTESGTGIVHQAPAFGEDDNRVLKKNGILETPCPVDDYGHFTQEVVDWAGKYIKDADKEIIKNLKERELLFEQSVLVHSYPFCYRSQKPLIYKTIPSWYVKVESFKDKLIANNKKINWVPEHIKEGRFGKWLENARDWAISRNRYWGNPLPVWQNDQSEEYICIGSIEELEKYSGIKVNDLHRETIDEITFQVNGQEGTYKRISDVLDCWFESGSMPYAQLHYPFENQEQFKQSYPAEYIAEGLDQTRGWFYTLNILSTALFDQPAFKNVIVNGIVLAKDGTKMSKSLKNYTAPDVLMEEYGADALRLFLINSALVKGEELKFSDAGVKDMVRRALLPWYNSFKFFTTYSQIDGWSPTKDLEFGDNILDKWLLSKLQSLIAQVNQEMDSYHLYNVVPPLFDFIEDLTNWYIRLNRRRFWETGLEPDKKQAYSALYTTLVNLSELMAPFAPFLSEYIYKELAKEGHLKEESVHLRSYPSENQELIDKDLETAVQRMQQIILLGRQKRNQTQVKVKTPLRELKIIHSDQGVLEGISKLESYLKTELNVKTISFDSDEAKYIKLYAKPNSPILGKRLGKSFGKFSGLIQKLDSDILRKIEEGSSIELEGENFTSNDLLLFREATEGSSALSNRFISIDLNCDLDEELLSEGLAREVVNRIQKTRKEINFNVADRVHLYFEGEEKLKRVIENHADYIKSETLSDQIQFQLIDTIERFPIEIDDLKAVIQLKKS